MRSLGKNKRRTFYLSCALGKKFPRYFVGEDGGGEEGRGGRGKERRKGGIEIVDAETVEAIIFKELESG